MIIIVTGTPGTGKTTYAKQLVERNGYVYIDVNEVIRSNNLSEGYDKEMKCDIVDTSKMSKVLITIIKDAKENEESLVIDSHLSHYIPSKYVDKCIVLVCSDRKILRKRLEKRGYSKKKVEENLESEIMESCLEDARSLGHKVEVVDGCKIKYDK